MAGTRITVEWIIHHLREADVLQWQGQTGIEVCRRFGVSEQTYYTNRH